MAFIRQCLQCGKKVLFFSLDENGLCKQCVEKNEQAKREEAWEKEKERLLAEHAKEHAKLQEEQENARAFYESLVRLLKTVMVDTDYCSLEDAHISVETCESFVSELTRIPTIPQFRKVFCEHCSYIGEDLVRNDDFGAMLVSSEGILDFAAIRDKALRTKKELEQILEVSEKFPDIVQSVPKVDVKINPNAKLHISGISQTLSLKTTNITQRTSLAKLNTFVVVDVETTGLNPLKDEIIQLSAVKYLGWHPVEAFCTYVKPRRGLQPGAQKVNGITEADVCDAPYIENVIDSFNDFIGKDVPIVGHNISFDFNFLVLNGSTVLLLTRKFYDTLDLSKREFSYLSKFKLDYLCRRCLHLIRPSCHDALSDCLATGILFKKICDLRIAR